MKSSVWTWALALAGCLFVSDAMAQQVRQPFSIRPAAFDYNRYLQDDAASPSDAPAAPPAAPGAEEDSAPAPVATAPAAEAASSGCCDTGCASSCCDSSCCDPCGSCCGGCSFGGIWECCIGDQYSISSEVLPECSAWSFGGWTQFGYHKRADFAFNQRPGKVDLQQQWFWVERTASPDCCNRIDWGFRADLVYGTDGPDTQAFGNTAGPADLDARGFDNNWDHGIFNAGYGWALPQLYGEVAAENWSVKAGHFFTLVGYEVVQAPDNFFYSHANTQYNTEPFTHTGGLATYTGIDNLELYGGWVAGWDTGFDQFLDGSMFLGGFSATVLDDLTLTYITTIGDTGFRGSDAYTHSIVMIANLSENLEYVLQSDLLQIDSTREDNVGLNQYLFYTVNDCVKLGGRFEWWKTDPLVLNPSGNLSFYNATFGVNLKPHANIIIRPEFRSDWVPATNFNEDSFNIDVIALF